MRPSRPRDRHRSIAVAAIFLIAALGLSTPPAIAQDDEIRYLAYLAAREDTASIAGPLSGEIIQDDQFSVTAGAGITTKDFSTTATFTNPANETGTPWDVGFTFHQTAGAAQQIAFDSDGFWYYTPVPEGTLQSGVVPAFAATPGGANTINLIVDGDSALFGINGELVTRIVLPPAVASDMLIGSGYFSTTSVTGRTIAYADFEVWPLPNVPETEATATPEPAVVAAETPAISAADTELFTAILATQAEVTPLAGPFNANLTEEEGRIGLSWANVDLRDFHARAVFGVPEPASDVPWSVGFMFRIGPQGSVRVAVDSLGNWFASAGSGGPAAAGQGTGIITEAGGANTIDLIVANERAVLGVNEELVATIDLATETGAADIAAGAGFYSDQTLPDRVTPFREFVVLPFDPDAVSATVDAGTTVTAAVAAEAFAEYAAESAQVAPFAGPFAGRLVEATPGAVPLAAARVSLADFAAVATFINPNDVATKLWDAGFEFRADSAVTNRIVVGSTGEVFALIPGQSPQIAGTATAYDPAPGARNQFQLFVRGDIALFGVNGDYVAAIALPAAPFASDVQVGTGFFAEDFVPDRVTAYEGFSIWQML